MDYEMEDLLPLVSELAGRYGGHESTSITYEKAQELMGAVIYCLEEYGHTYTDGLMNRDMPVKEQYAIGLKLVFEKAERIRGLFNELSSYFEDYGVECLYDTVQKGIPEFLKWYDVRFHPQNTIITMDYPLLMDCSSLRGADAVYQYLLCIRAEQRFLGRFGKEYVASVLEKYDGNYQGMIENICEVVLANTVGHIGIQRPLTGAGFQKEEYMQLTELFQGKSVTDTEKIVERYVEEMVRRFYENDAGLLEYLCHGTRNIAVRIHTACKFQQLDKLFVL